MFTIIVTLPSLIVLGILFLKTFGQSDATIAFMPFVYIKVVVERIRNIPLTIMMSMLFSIVLLIILMIKKIRPSIEFNFAFLMAFVGIIQFLFLAETGSRFIHGNFAWSIASGYSVLYFYSSKELLKNFNNLKGYRTLLIVVLFLHIISGLSYAFSMINGVVA